MIDPTTAHRQLITKHNTIGFVSDLGRVSARKTNGRYIVRAESFTTQHESRMEFKTLLGALIAINELKEHWL